MISDQQECLLKCFRCREFVTVAPLVKSVCGSDYKTYSDSCELLCASCDNPGLAKQCNGECPCNKEFKNPCFKLCHDEFDLTCGINNDSYPSPCILEQIACLNPDMGITQQCEGKCPCKSNRDPCHTYLNWEYRW